VRIEVSGFHCFEALLHGVLDRGVFFIQSCLLLFPPSHIVLFRRGESPIIGSVGTKLYQSHTHSQTRILRKKKPISPAIRPYLLLFLATSERGS
jgi:hypothetical protein